MIRIFVFFTLMALTSPAIAAPNRVLVYGDSNTWGWIPVKEGYPTTRFGEKLRWTGVMAKALGPDTIVLTDALNGRTVDQDYDADQGAVKANHYNGTKHIGFSIARELPLDLVVIMLATNDYAVQRGDKKPEDIAKSLIDLAKQVQAMNNYAGTCYPAPKVLLVAPPALGDTSQTELRTHFQGRQEKSRATAKAIVDAATQNGIPVFDANRVITTDGIDGIHFTAKTHRVLGKALAAQIKPMIQLHKALPCAPKPHETKE